ncbi:flagellar assembly protein T N-terminal domain-containing protein [Desulfonatronum sp. SC1]|uniref:flagellar assembly protein T N-terminal domain-containing protein n=1 Tax=Desulfonatronum sp. SC1 TaxID=2109626 RepID=UPI001304978D|nr:flagellar assembly protein T N-terminal domain-containing protein [Desulfonatronum sp. SC1]
MRQYRFLLLVVTLLLLLPLLPCVGFAQEEFVEAEGVAALIGGNTVVAREKALDDALRKAVEQSVGTLISSDTLTEQYRVVHDKVLAQTAGYIQSYSVVREYQTGDIYRVVVRALVGRANLMNDLQALGLLQVLVEKPKVAILIEEKVAGVFGTQGFEAMGQAESLLMQKFLNAGFTVVDPVNIKENIDRNVILRKLEADDHAASVAGLQVGAQIVVSGKSYSKNAGGQLWGTQLQSLQGSVQIRAVRVDDARVISSQSAFANAAHVDEVQGGMQAIRNAADQAGDAMIRDIASLWQTETYGRTRLVTVMISNLHSYRHLVAIKNFFEKEMQGVRAVHQRSYIHNTAELALDYSGRSSNIADELAIRDFTDFVLEPTNVTPTRVDFRVHPIQ